MEFLPDHFAGCFGRLQLPLARIVVYSYCCSDFLTLRYRDVSPGAHVFSQSEVLLVRMLPKAHVAFSDIMIVACLSNASLPCRQSGFQFCNPLVCSHDRMQWLLPPHDSTLEDFATHLALWLLAAETLAATDASADSAGDCSFGISVDTNVDSEP